MINSFICEANLTREPIYRKGDNYEMLSFGLCTNTVKKIDGEYQTIPLFFNATLFGKKCSFFKELKKGDGVVVSGVLGNDQYTNKDGETKSQLTLNIYEMAAKAKIERVNDDNIDDLPV